MTSGNEAPVFVGRTAVERVNSFKLLGVHISDDASWAQHIVAITNNDQPNLYFFCILSGFVMPQNTLIELSTMYDGEQTEWLYHDLVWSLKR